MMLRVGGRQGAAKAVVVVAVVVAAATFALAVFAGSASAKETELVPILLGHQTFCVHEDFATGSALRFEYEVNAGGRAAHIDYAVYSPSGHLRDQGKSLRTALFEVDSVQAAGTWKFCISNPDFVSQRVVYILVSVDGHEDRENWEKVQEQHLESDETQTLLNSLAKTRDFLTESVRYLVHMRNSEALHRAVAEQNNTEVMLFSVVEIVLVVAIAVFQVIFLRTLFSDTTTSRS